MILTIGNTGALDVPAYRHVVQYLEAHNEAVLLFKQDLCLDGEAFIFRIRNGRPEYLVCIDGTHYDVNDFSAVWYLKPHLPRRLLEYEPAEHRAFISRQFLVMRQALWAILRYHYWVDNPFAVADAENKIVQLQRAREAGLNVPPTLIANDPGAVQEFCARHSEGSVVKVLAPTQLYGHALYTNLVTPEHLREIDTLRLAPAIFQARIPKAYELRITIVGNRTFAVRIDSQSDPETSLDWRRKPSLNDFDVPMRSTELPEDIDQRLRALLASLGLRCGCIDMIVTPDGNYVFLEINPNGQWHFAQLGTDSNIAEAIAELLLRNTN
jgi:glutathione synthase/RimK-type ligase-like ATP-grasp enzyme